MLRRTIRCGAVFFAACAPAGECRAIIVGELDTFSVNLEGWQQGQPPIGTLGVTRETTGGPAGAGDAFMRIQADDAGQHGKLVAFNTAQWSGNYLSAKISGVLLSVRNLGATDLSLRLALGTDESGRMGSWFASTSGIALPSGSGWTNVLFPVNAGSLQSVLGTSDFSTVMSSVAALRILHATVPDNQGTEITGILGVDNIRAIGVPGDYNGNGSVDAADFTVWRDRKDATGPDLAADGTGAAGIPDGVVNDLDYDFWKSRFGTSGAGAFAGDGGATAIPEPYAAWLAMAAAILAAATRTAARHRRHQCHG